MTAKKIKLLITTSCALVLVACVTTNVNLPSITETPTGERLPGKIVWHDLLTNDPAASKRFYGELFGWEFEGVSSLAGLGSDTAYTLIRHNGRLIGGMIDTKALNNRTDISQWVVVMSVEDVDAAAASFANNGGSVLTPPKDLQRRGRIAVVQDPAGALLALLETKDGDPVDREPELGDFLWNELWTVDVDGATKFYSDAAGYDAADWNTGGDEESPANYRLLKYGDKPRVGILANPFEDLDPVWVSYLRVESPAAITARVEELGGKVIVEARPRALGGEVAFIAGPSEAGIALQTWPLK
ncbi:MAG: VOC family protein [Gammaproteobacteria bacterium]|nr:MAG: VOC family protein [Gammaproteobacteria bacterium]RLA36099.1 MAG: VOC family protein [Gammaproteobacteria bacterium]